MEPSLSHVGGFEPELFQQLNNWTSCHKFISFHAAASPMVQVVYGLPLLLTLHVFWPSVHQCAVFDGCSDGLVCSWLCFQNTKMCGQTSKDSANDLWLVKVVLIGEENFDVMLYNDFHVQELLLWFTNRAQQSSMVTLRLSWKALQDNVSTSTWL